MSGNHTVYVNRREKKASTVARHRELDDATQYYEIESNHVFIIAVAHQHRKPESGGAGESHPHAPTDPNVTVSRHSALITQPLG